MEASSLWQLTPLGALSHKPKCQHCEDFATHIMSCWMANEVGLRPLAQGVVDSRVRLLECQLALSELQRSAQSTGAGPSLESQSILEERIRILTQEKLDIEQQLEMERSTSSYA
ncbi:hypothetical protein ONZ45_g9662 [Pleurotus djamor]|nr:hypothetical protein ONZ45_g9662 [Pleurotus djamor]